MIGADDKWVGNEERLNALEEYYSMEKRVTPETPQTFISHSTNDKTLVDNSLIYYKSLITNKVPVEMHIWKTGGHGWGFASEKLVGKGKDKLAAHRRNSIPPWRAGWKISDNLWILCLPHESLNHMAVKLA